MANFVDMKRLRDWINPALPVLLFLVAKAC
jgi:hypothetical protein